MADFMQENGDDGTVFWPKSERTRRWLDANVKDQMLWDGVSLYVPKKQRRGARNAEAFVLLMRRDNLTVE